MIWFSLRSLVSSCWWKTTLHFFCNVKTIQVAAQQRHVRRDDPDRCAADTRRDKITDDNTGLPFVVSVFSDLLAGRWQLVFGANISNCPATRAMLDISEGSILLCVVTSRAAHSARDKEKESRNQHSKDYWGSLISFCATPAIHSGCSISVKRIGK